MPTLDRRLLAWSDSDTEDDEPASWDLAVDDGSSYDRCGAATAFVDDVLVLPGADGGDSSRTRAGPSSGTRKACAAAAGLVAVGCLFAYLAWRCGTTTQPS